MTRSQVVLRIDPSDKRALTKLAAREGVPVNTLVARMIARTVRRPQARRAPETAVRRRLETKAGA
jgi:hypothetical protein